MTQNPWHDDMQTAPRNKKLDLYCPRNKAIYKDMRHTEKMGHGGYERGWLDPRDQSIYPSERFSHWKRVDVIKPPKSKRM